MIFLGMRLVWALRSPKTFVVAVVAGVVGARIHGEHSRPVAAMAHGIGAVAIAMLMPMTFRHGQVWVYFAYGLVVGAVAGAIVGATKPRTPPEEDEAPQGSGLGLDVLKGAGLGVAMNLLLAVWTYV